MILTQKTTLDQILSFISKEYNLTEYEVCKKIRKGINVEARQLFCYIAKLETKLSLQDIADFITIKGRRVNPYDHATVIHSIKTISNYMDVDLKSRRKVYTIQNKLQEKKDSLIVSKVDLLYSCL